MAFKTSYRHIFKAVGQGLVHSIAFYPPKATCSNRESEPASLRIQQSQNVPRDVPQTLRDVLPIFTPFPAKRKSPLSSACSPLSHHPLRSTFGLVRDRSTWKKRRLCVEKTKEKRRKEIKRKGEKTADTHFVRNYGARSDGFRFIVWSVCRHFPRKTRRQTMTRSTWHVPPFSLVFSTAWPEWDTCRYENVVKPILLGGHTTWISTSARPRGSLLLSDRQKKSWTSPERQDQNRFPNSNDRRDKTSRKRWSVFQRMSTPFSGAGGGGGLLPALSCT